MPSLSQLLTDHRCLLVLDAASQHIQVGLLRAGAPALWRTTTEEAGRAIFTCTEAILSEAKLPIAAIDAFVFCEGPGSMLGIRTVAMALRTWQILKPRPVFSYQSLAVAGHFEWTKSEPRAFAVIADARRDTWHHQPVEIDGRIPPLRRLAPADLPEGERVTPEYFRAWATPPGPVATGSYDLAAIFPSLAQGDFFRAVDAPDAFQHEAPEYKKISGEDSFSADGG